jgi:hypothetical protein
MGVIDLDVPPPQPPASAGRTRPLVALSVAFAVAVSLGAAGLPSWQRHRTLQAESDVVSVRIATDGNAGADGSEVGGVVSGGRVTDASLNRRVTLVNTGPLPLEVRELVADGPGVRVRGEAHRLAPGQSVQAEADVDVVCSRGLPIRTLPVRLRVRTADDELRTATATLDATRWNDQARTVCAGDLS